MVYIAADNSLPLIEWQENVTSFCVTELSDDEKVVRKQFTKPFIVYAGSFGGCSCGFAYDDSPVEDGGDARDDALSRKSVRELSEYLSNAVRSGPVEIFACWAGDEEAEPEDWLVVTPAYFGGEQFKFNERQFLLVS